MLRLELDTLQMASRLLLDTLQTPNRDLSDTHQTSLRHPADTHQIYRFFPSGKISVLVVVVLLLVTRGKQSQLPLQPTKVELALQVGVEFDKQKCVYC